MSRAASGWQKSLLLEWCYNVFFVCGRGHEGEEQRAQQREPTGFSGPRHVLVGRGVAFVDAVCRQICAGALQEADDLCGP